jgi:uncharacterized protein with HEPN domain
VSRALYERLCDIKERCEQLVEDLHGDPASVGNDRVLAKAVLYDLHVIGEACGALPDEFRARHGDVDWKGWKDFRNLTTHQYWRADATIAAEAMERAIGPLSNTDRVIALGLGVQPGWLERFYSSPSIGGERQHFGHEEA